MSKSLVAIIISILALALSVVIFTSSPRFAYVESNIILEKYSGAKKARETLETEGKVWQGNIQTLATELDSLKKEWVTNEKKWSSANKKERQQHIIKKQEDFGRYSQAIQQKAAQREQELMGPIFDEINGYIEEYAEENGYDMIFGTLQGNIVYSKKTFNVTKEVLQYINEQY